jgi:hypothetical protein
MRFNLEVRPIAVCGEMLLRWRILMRTLIVAMMVLVAGCQSSQERTGAGNVKATVRQVTGQAEVRSAGTNGTWERARAGADLREGDEARTAADGQLDVQLSPHGGVLSLTGDSHLQIERLGAGADEPNAVAVLRLTRGTIIGDTLKLPKGKRVVVKTNGGTFQVP